MANELAGLRILNTRPAAQAAGLSASLRAAGAEVLELPLIEIEALPVVGPERQLLLELDRYDYVFVVSANAARLGLAAIADYWPQWPHQLLVLAVGRATAALLEADGLTVICPPQEDSEGVLALPELAAASGLRVLVLRGEDGRELVADTLRARGARVDVVALYQRVLPAVAAASWQQLRQPLPDCVLLSSPAAWRHWQIVAGAEAVLPWLLVVSPRLLEQVQAAGAKKTLLAEGAGTEAIKACLSRWRTSGEHAIQ
jgi:uroporphyrinogen-III synthase